MTVTKVGVYGERCNIFPKKLDSVSIFLPKDCCFFRLALSLQRCSVETHFKIAQSLSNHHLAEIMSKKSHIEIMRYLAWISA